MAEERIQKIMSEQGLCSRRAAEQIIAEGRVKVNGHPVKVGDKMDPNRDVLHVDDERIYIQKNQQMYYLALYKPRGYVTTASDELGRKTVMELVADIPARLYPVGRLDKDSEGLLLMTNDGAFAQAVTHPSGGISKLYRVTVQPRADEAQLLKLSSGVVLDDGTRTLPHQRRHRRAGPRRHGDDLERGQEPRDPPDVRGRGPRGHPSEAERRGRRQAGDAPARQVPRADQGRGERPACRSRQGPRPDPLGRFAVQGCCPPSPGPCGREQSRCGQKAQVRNVSEISAPFAKFVTFPEKKEWNKA